MNKILLILTIIINGIFANYMTITNSEYSMWYAIRNGSPHIVEKLLINGLNPNKIVKWNTFLALAAQRSTLHKYVFYGVDDDRISVIKLLLKHGANPCLLNGEGLTPYEHYLKYIHLYPDQQVKELLDICTESNITHAPEYEKCANSHWYKNCTQYPYQNNIFSQFDANVIIIKPNNNSTNNTVSNTVINSFLFGSLLVNFVNMFL